MTPAARVDPRTLPPLLLHPGRPRLAAARAAAEGASNGSEAWRRMITARVVPESLAAAPARRFAVVDTGWTPAPSNAAGASLQPVPATVDGAITIAADADGVLDTERLARAVRDRLIPWGALPPTETDWYIFTHQVPFNFEQGPVLNAVMYSVEYALDEAGIAMAALVPDQPWLPPVVNEAIRAREGWDRAVAEELEVPGAYDVPRSVVGTPFAALESPFDLVLAIWSRGYVLDHVCYDNAPEIRIFTTVVDAPQNLRRTLMDQARQREP